MWPTMVADQSLTEELKPRNSVSKNGRLMRYTTFDGWPALFDMFNILISPINVKKRQMIRRLPEWRQCPFIGDYFSVDCFCHSLFWKIADVT